LDRFFGDSAEVIRRVIKKRYSSDYKNYSSYENLRAMVFKDLFIKEINLGRHTYSNLLERLDGFYDISDLNKYRRISDYFIKIFDGKSLSEILLALLGDNFSDDEITRLNRNIINKKKLRNPDLYTEYVNKVDQNELLQRAYNLLKSKIWENANTAYSSTQFCFDLGFEHMFLLTPKTIKSSPNKLIKKFLGRSFNELVVQALGLRGKAISLVHDHLNEIATKSGVSGYHCVNLLEDLGFNNLYSKNTLKTKQERIIKRFIGFSSFHEIIYIVRNQN
jgi:hypothetical protein